MLIPMSMTHPVHNNVIRDIFQFQNLSTANTNIAGNINKQIGTINNVNKCYKILTRINYK